MTAQIMQTLRYEDQEWAVCEFMGDTNCVPSSDALGFETEMESTANYSGRVDNWLVDGKKLILHKIQVNLTEKCRGFFPNDGGRQTIIDEYRCTVYDNNGTRIEIIKETKEFLVYNDLHVKFSGRIICGRNFNKDLYVHMGVQTANRFEDRLYLEFREGILLENSVIKESGSFDDSAECLPGEYGKIMQEIRAKMEDDAAKKREYWRKTLK